VSVDTLRGAAAEGAGAFAALLLPPDAGLDNLPVVELSEAEVRDIARGRFITPGSMPPGDGPGPIRLLAPEVICTLGRPAAHALLEVATPIGRLRGHFGAYRGTPVMPTFHPSYLLRSPGESRYAWQDLQQVMRRLGLPLPAASRAREER